MDKQCKTVTIDVNAHEVKLSLKKVQRLVKLLEEANSLVDELASKNIKLKIDVEI